MAATDAPIAEPRPGQPGTREPLLEAGDRLSREGAPELAVEIVGSSQAYDLHQKKGAYRRNGACEYLAWVTEEQKIIWWELYEGEYREIAADSDELIKSRVFPGLWLDAAALLRDDLKTVLASLRRGIDAPQHKDFVTR